MSLRICLIAYTVLILVVSLALGAALAVWHAEQSVRTELVAAMEVGKQALRNGVDEFSNTADPMGEARRLVGIFDGNRHVRATLLDQAGSVVATSEPLEPDPIPHWFLWAVDPRLEQVRVGLPPAAGGDSIVLVAFPDNEAGEVWRQYGDSGVTLGAFCLLTSLLIMSVVGRGLRPLRALSDAFGRIGAGDYDVQMTPSGAPELRALATGFNRMALQLAAMRRQNRRLHEQLLTLQDEERAELARDLHDEIGPYLFSVNVSASTTGQLVASGRLEDVPGQLRDIREAVGHMQKHVKSILARLRPVRAVEFGVAQAITELMAFWQARHARIAFRATIGPEIDGLDDATQEVVYRVVQESLSNAVRHGRPSGIDVAVAVEDGRVAVVVTDDGGAAAGTATAGLGLIGMRERVATLGGTLAAGPDPAARGWRVRARLPCSPAHDLEQAA